MASSSGIRDKPSVPSRSRIITFPSWFFPEILVPSFRPQRRILNYFKEYISVLSTAKHFTATFLKGLVVDVFRTIRMVFPNTSQQMKQCFYPRAPIYKKDEMNAKLVLVKVGRCASFATSMVEERSGI
mgnify:CR=1 FL=1